jgi:hypothetical protein
MRHHGVLISTAVATAFLLNTSVSYAVDPDAKCQSSKLKAWARLRSCEHKASAKAVTGATVDASACESKFDAAMAKVGAACRYLDNGDGTVTDLDTGLMWQKTDDAGGLTDKGNVYTWSDSGTAPDGTAFTVFLAGLNGCQSADGFAVSGGYAGYCDWRMPENDELKSIADCSFGNPCVDQSAFGPTLPSSPYWSATSITGNLDGAWGVYFYDGDLLNGFKGFNNLVRAVRSGL